MEVFVSEVEELFSEGEGEAVVLVEAFFLVVVVDEVSEAPVLFFLAVAEVELLAVVDFLVVAVADAFFPPAVLAVVVWVEVLAEADSLLCAQEVTKATPTRRVMKEKTVFFIGLCKGAQTVQPPPRPQAYSLAWNHFSEASGAQPPNIHKPAHIGEQVGRSVDEDDGPKIPCPGPDQAKDDGSRRQNHDRVGDAIQNSGMGSQSLHLTGLPEDEAGRMGQPE